MPQPLMQKKLKLNDSVKTYKTFKNLTGKKVALFIIGDWNAKVGNQEIPGVTGKFGLGVQNEERQRLTDFCQENSKHPLPTTQKTPLHVDITKCSVLKSD